MAIERDNTFSTGADGMDQGRDFGGSGSGLRSADQTNGIDTDREEPVIARARGAVSDAGHRAAERVQERINDQMNRTTGQLESVASSLRSASVQMSEESMEKYMLQAATQVDNFATFLNKRDVSEVIGEVEGFARRQPAVFIGGAFALGVLGARFLRSSRHQLERDNQEQWRSGISTDQANGQSGRAEFRGDSRGYPERAPDYGNDQLMDRSPGSGYPSGSYQAAGAAGLEHRPPRRSPTESRDLASDQPRTRDSLVGEGRSGRAGTEMDASGLRKSGSAERGRASDARGDDRDQSGSDPEIRERMQSPDYL